MVGLLRGLWDLFSPRLLPGTRAQLFDDLGRALAAGLPLVSALGRIAGQAGSRKRRRLVQRIETGLRAGQDLQAALARSRDALEPADSGLLALGAESGTLEQVLGGLAAHHRRRERLARETLALLTRPILTFLIAVVLGSSLVLFLPDKLTRTLREQITFPLGPREPSARERFQARLEGRAALPAPPERWRLYLNLVSLPTGALALLVVGGCFGAAVAQALPGGGRLTSTAAVMTPIFGPALRLQAQARFLDALALGIAAGAPLLRSLKLAADAMASPALAAPIERARDDLLRGRGLAEALRDRRALPAELIDRIAMAESLGTFDAALAASARELEQRAEERLRSAAMALQPLTFFLVALYFLGLLIAILGSALSAALSKG